MFRLESIRHWHRGAVVLAVALGWTTVACLSALNPSAIPDHLLSHVRGMNKDMKKNPTGETCDTTNVFFANLLYAPPTYVRWADCAKVGTNCILCRQQKDYTLQFDKGTANPVNNKFANEIDCNPSGGLGQLGSCILVGASVMCSQTGDYDCEFTVTDFSAQGQ